MDLSVLGAPIRAERPYWIPTAVWSDRGEADHTAGKRWEGMRSEGLASIDGQEPPKHGQRSSRIEFGRG